MFYGTTYNYNGRTIGVAKGMGNYYVVAWFPRPQISIRIQGLPVSASTDPNAVQAELDTWAADHGVIAAPNSDAGGTALATPTHREIAAAA